jgi:group I intron endonuclease
MVIKKAILKYGHSIFSFRILEYCGCMHARMFGARMHACTPPENVVAREQYYMDLLKPEHNPCRIAGSSLGRRHTETTVAKISEAMSGRKLSEEHKKRLSKTLRGYKGQNKRDIVWPRMLRRYKGQNEAFFTYSYIG